MMGRDEAISVHCVIAVCRNEKKKSSTGFQRRPGSASTDRAPAYCCGLEVVRYAQFKGSRATALHCSVALLLAVDRRRRRRRRC